MPTLNINVSQETIDKISSLESDGITKKRIVDVAVANVSIDTILDSIKQKSQKSGDKNKNDWEKQIELVMVLQKKIDELLHHSKAIDLYKSHICDEYNLQCNQSHGSI